VPTDSDAPGLLIGRRRRLAAATIDAAGALAAIAVGAAVATAWLMLRTGFGRADVDGGDAIAAVSFVGATIPAWAAWLALRVRRDGCTPGQRRARMFVEPLPGAMSWRRQLRLAAHPLTLPVWGWLTLTALLSGVPWLWLPVAAGGMVVALAGVLSFALLLVRPELNAMHDLLARTRLAERR
jgi:hypothetical protein